MLRIFGGDRISKMMEMFQIDVDVPIESGMLVSLVLSCLACADDFSDAKPLQSKIKMEASPWKHLLLY